MSTPTTRAGTGPSVGRAPPGSGRPRTRRRGTSRPGGARESPPRAPRTCGRAPDRGRRAPRTPPRPAARRRRGASRRARGRRHATPLKQAERPLTTARSGAASRPPSRRRQTSEKKRVIIDALLELAELRLRALAAREGDRELRVAAAGGEREREAAAEARVHVRHRQAAVRLAEALDVRRPLDPDGLGDEAPVLDQLLVLDGRALDRLAPFRQEHRPRDRVQAPRRPCRRRRRSRTPRPGSAPGRTTARAV